jgi:uncharacterized membrane protein
LRITRLKFLLLVAMSTFGLWASGMVMVVFYEMKQALPFCPSNEGPGLVLNCQAVLGSSYSMVFGVPLELFAVAYFVINILLVCAIAFGPGRLFNGAFDILFAWRFIGILLVPYLVFVEVFIVRAICLYCTFMHIAIVADFVVITYFLFYKKGLDPPETRA